MNLEQIIQYVQDNLIFCIIVAACLLAVIILLIVIIASSSKAKKKQKAEQTAAQEVSVAEEPATAVEETPAVEEPVAAAEETPVVEEPVAETEDEEAKSAYSGKWVISKMAAVNAAGEEVESAFFFQLKASNGEQLITSEDYTSLRGANQGIETFKANIEKGNFKISISKKGKYIIKLLTSQGSLLTHGEKYSSRKQALNAIASIKRFAATAVLVEDVQVTTVPYEEVTAVEHNYDASKKGKWVIRQVIMDSEKDASYCFELHASNGQMLFTSEEYSTVAGLKNGIKTHKNNIEKGNIRAVITRNGDYIFKIFAGNGHLLCLGEHYKNKQLCLNAIESVKRFAQSAELNLDNLTIEE